MQWLVIVSLKKMTEAPVLGSAYPKGYFALDTYSSAISIEAVLFHVHKGEQKVVAYSIITEKNFQP